MKKQSLSSICKCRMLLWMWKSLDSKKCVTKMIFLSAVLFLLFFFLPAGKQYKVMLCLGPGSSLSDLLQGLISIKHICDLIFVKIFVFFYSGEL